MSLENGIDNLGEKLASHNWVSDCFGISKCSKCGFKAISTTVIPTVFDNLYIEILSCDEMTIKDIIE